MSTLILRETCLGPTVIVAASLCVKCSGRHAGDQNFGLCMIASANSYAFEAQQLVLGLVLLVHVVPAANGN